MFPFGGRRQGTGQSPEGHRVTLVRSVLRKPLPLCGGFPAGGAGLAGGDRSGQQRRCPLRDRISAIYNQVVSCAHLLYIHTFIPAVTPATWSPAPMSRIIRARKGAGEQRAGHAMPFGQCAGPGPRTSRPRPYNRLQAIALRQGKNTLCFRGSHSYGPRRWALRPPVSFAAGGVAWAAGPKRTFADRSAARPQACPSPFWADELFNG